MTIESRFGRFFAMFFHSSIYLSLGCALVGGTSALLIGTEIPLKVVMILFLGTFSAYNLNRYTDLKEDSLSHPERTRFIKDQSRVLKTSFLVSYGAVLLLAALVNYQTALFVIVPIIVVLIYGAEFPKGRIKRLKEIFLVKNLVIASVWAFSIVFLLYLSNPFVLTANVVATFFSIFIFTFLNTIIFDVRDIEGDKANGIHTIPVELGLENTKKILIILDLAFIFLLFLLIVLKIISFYFLISIITSFYLLSLIFLMGKLDEYIVADILADGWLIVFGILGVLVRFI